MSGINETMIEETSVNLDYNEDQQLFHFNPDVDTTKYVHPGWITLGAIRITHAVAFARYMDGRYAELPKRDLVTLEFEQFCRLKGINTTQTYLTADGLFASLGFRRDTSLITDGLLISLGFKRERTWDARQDNFTLKYSIEGFDGQIDLYASFCAPGSWSPEKQVEDGSDIDFLIENCQNGYHVYGNDFHIVTIDSEAELVALVSCLKIDICND